MIKIKFEEGLFDKLVAAMYVGIIAIAIKFTKVQYDMYLVYREMNKETKMTVEIPDKVAYIAMYMILGAATFMFFRKMRRHLSKNSE